MNLESSADAVAAPLPTVALRQRLEDYWALGKPRVVSMVLLTTGAGFYLARPDAPAFWPLLHVLVGTALAAGGTLGLNQYMERDLDAHMDRTRHRPLPDGRLGSGEALLVSGGTLLAGLAYLWCWSTPPAMLFTAAITAIYLGAYTPLKRRSALCSIVGAIPGALPPVVGWAAAEGTVDPLAWVLFAIMFLWQLPHSLALARLYREDYARAGIQLLPVVDRDGSSTGRQVAINCFALLPIGLLPTLIGVAGPVYFFVALVLGAAFLWSGVQMAWSDTVVRARRVLVMSFVYLPVLLTVLMIDCYPLGR